MLKIGDYVIFFWPNGECVLHFFVSPQKGLWSVLSHLMVILVISLGLSI